MSRPTFVYFAADSHRNVWIQTTKDLDVAIYFDEEILKRPLRLVRKEEFSTLAGALERIRKIRKMAIPRRRQIIERENPSYANLLPASSYGDHGNPEEESGNGGVGARLPIPILPRSGHDAKEPPSFPKS